MTWQDFCLKILHLFFVESLGILVWPFVIWSVARPHRDQVKDFLARLTKIGLSGAEAAPPMQQPGGDLIRKQNENSVPSVLQPDEAIAEIENRARTALKQRGIDLDKLDESAREQLFFREYATLVINSQFQIIANSIFASQIEALRRLYNSESQSKKALLEIYERHVADAVKKDVPPIEFNSWIEFLISNELVAFNHDGDYVITKFGKKFVIEWLPRINLSLKLF